MILLILGPVKQGLGEVATVGQRVLLGRVVVGGHLHHSPHTLDFAQAQAGPFLQVVPREKMVYIEWCKLRGFTQTKLAIKLKMLF